MAPGTEFARDFCAGIGPLQLGVVLVYLRKKPKRNFPAAVRSLCTLTLHSVSYFLRKHEDEQVSRRDT